MTKNCRKTCGICKGGKEEIKSSELQATDCKQSSWGEWSKCSKSCGEGSQKRQRTVAKTEKHGGKACVGSNTERKPCNTQKCGKYDKLNLYILD